MKDYVDLYDLCRLLFSKTGDTKVKTAAKATMNMVVASLVVAKASNSLLKNPFLV